MLNYRNFPETVGSGLKTGVYLDRAFPGVETINDYYVTRGTYRVCVTVKVYDASNKLLETQSEYSAVKIY